MSEQLHIEYDGTLDGFLNVLARCIKEGVHPLSISTAGRRRRGMFDEVDTWETDCGQAQRLADYLKNLHLNCLNVVIHAFLSEDDDVALAAYNFVLLSLEIGNKVLFYHSDSSVRRVLDVSAKLLHEVHSFTGFVRFREIGSSVFYAPIEPINNITLLVAEHFTQRLPLQEWVIHDVGRDIALYWDREELRTVAIEKDFARYVRFHGDAPGKTEAEEHFQELWQVFHTNISNPARVNKKLQRQFIPQRYWKYLIEKDR